MSEYLCPMSTWSDAVSLMGESYRYFPIDSLEFKFFWRIEQ